jgi:Flp pilus assembly protein TadG
MIRPEKLRPDGVLGRLVRDRRGGTAILTALMMTTMLGFVGLGVDAGLWLHLRQSTQAIADSAATAAVMSDSSGGGGGRGDASGSAQAEALAMAAAHGLIDGENGVAITSGWRKARDAAVFDVTIRRPTPLLFARALIGQTSELEVRATAAPDAACAGKPGCVARLVE